MCFEKKNVYSKIQLGEGNENQRGKGTGDEKKTIVLYGNTNDNRTISDRFGVRTG